jgi:hypothetical protein
MNFRAGWEDLTFSVRPEEAASERPSRRARDSRKSRQPSRRGRSEAPAPCISKLWGAVLCELTDRARGAGCGPFGIGRGGAGSDHRCTLPQPARKELLGVVVAAAPTCNFHRHGRQHASGCPGGRPLRKPLSLCLRWAPRPRRPCRGASQGHEPAFARPVDDGSGSGDPDIHTNGGAVR